MILEVNDRSFEVIRLLGKGKGGYSYLVTDGVGEYVLKQIHHEPCEYYQFGDKLASELGDYDRLLRAGVPMPRLLEVDQGRERLLKEYVDGPTVYELVLREELTEDHLHQVRSMSAMTRDQGLNLDWFPTNFAQQQGKLFYIDYECNSYMDQWSFENWGIGYWQKTPQFLDYAWNRGDL